MIKTRGHPEMKYSSLISSFTAAYSAVQSDQLSGD